MPLNIDEDARQSPLLAAAVADRERQPWVYYWLGRDTLKRLLNEHSDELARVREENAILARALGQDSQELRDEVTRRREAFRTVLVRAQDAEATIAHVRAFRQRCVEWRDAPMPARGGKIEVQTIRKTLNVVISELDTILNKE